MTETRPFKTGDKAEMSVEVTGELVQRFADYSGDHNPLHVDAEYAGATRFHRRVAHGMSYGALFSRLIGMELPGPGALWASQSFRFAKPAFIGDELVLSVEVEDVSQSTGLITLACRAVNQLGEEIMSGSGEVMFAALKPAGDRADVETTSSESAEAASVESARSKPKSKSASSGPVAIVTGGSRGIGAATARRLDDLGFHVAIIYRSSREEAEALAKSLRSAVALKADLSDPNEASLVPDRVNQALGAPTIVVLNASDRDLYGEAADGDFSRFERHWAMQLASSHALVSAVLPTMIEAGSGRIVAIGSTYARGTPPAAMAPYVVAKAALAAWVRCLAVDYGKHGVRANMVTAGMTETALLSAVPDRQKKVAAAKNPMRRLGQPEDVADAVAYLVGDESRYVNGHSLVVSGGDLML